MKKQFILFLILVIIALTSGILWKLVCTPKNIPVSSHSTTEDSSFATEESTENPKESILSLLQKVEHGIDSDFGAWLYENYPQACEAICQSTEENGYEDSLWHKETGKSLFVLRDTFLGHLNSSDVALTNHIYQKDCANENQIELCFAGDISFADDSVPSRNYNAKGIGGCFSQELRDTMKRGDIFMVNNEFCYSTRGTRLAGKTYTFRGNPSHVTRLDEMGVDVVSIANNHAYDFGADAFLDTVATLDGDHMPYIGGGKNLEDAMAPRYFIANGIKIAYVAGTQIERDGILTQPATDTTPGVLRCYDPAMLCDMIKEAKKNADFVIAYVHWGTEYVEHIQEDEQILAHTFSDAGADLIVGGHTHCMQGAEYYNNTPIFYGLSNFCFSGKVINSSVLSITLDETGITQAKYIPCMEIQGYTHQCDKNDTDYNRIINLLNEVSENVTINQDGMVTFPLSSH